MKGGAAGSGFEQAVLPHLDSAYNLARWLTRDDQDARDVVQEACLRALRFFPSFRGGDGRAWLLGIVRNASYDWLRERGAAESAMAFDEDTYVPDDAATPESLLLQRADRQMIRRAIEMLPAAWREVLVLRELEGLSYKEIAAVAAIPVGTVMSRLARARGRLQQYLAEHAGRGEST